MLHFARPLTEVHGCLLTSSDLKEDEVVRTVTRTVRGILRRCEGDADVVSRNISLFLLLNTELDWPPGLAELDGLASCVGLVEPIAKSVFIQIIRSVVHQNKRRWCKKCKLIDVKHVFRADQHVVLMHDVSQ